MTHDHASGTASPACPACKKIINNYVFIKNLAPLVTSEKSSWLAAVANAYSDIISALGIKPSFEGFTGCDEAKTLLSWISGKVEPDDELVQKWVDTFLAEIGELAAGKMPK